jgi:hypothetical protein
MRVSEGVVMEVLVVESELGAADAAIAALEAADHRVLRCHEPGADPFPCRGLEPGECPLERGTVQVVLDVRGHSTPHPDPLEDGVTCGLRRRLPLVVAGLSASNPFARFVVLDASRQDVVAACELAANGPREDHEKVADAALQATLQRAGRDQQGSSSVRLTARGLQVTLFLPEDTDAKTREMAAVRVVGALRRYDRHSARIDVACEAIL